MSETHVIGSGRMSAAISAQGAELRSLKDARGVELLWQAGPEWPRHAPNLFPIVGRLAGDTLRHEGKSYRMTQHGFARDSLFRWTERSESRASLRLEANAATRAAYPFEFALDLIYMVENAALSATSRVSNPGDVPLPFCIGAHPGFRWPLADGIVQEAHILDFAAQEPGPARSIEDGLLGPAEPLPFDGRTLELNPGLFAGDAVVMPSVASRFVRYAALRSDGSAARSIMLSWRGYEDLGVWSKPTGAPFLCIEPWRGMASPVGWDGPFVEKPGVVLLAPGGVMDFEWRVLT
jgi:galactose mutarotase-like enzyme